MSKCQEERDKWFEKHAYGSQKLTSRIWQAAWNAALEHAAEVSEENNADLDECLWCDCAEAIRKEKTE